MNSIAPNLDLSVSRIGVQGDGTALGERAAEGEMPMLVNVAELVEQPERVILHGVPSVVWLHLFDDTLNGRAEMAGCPCAAHHVRPDGGVDRAHHVIGVRRGAEVRHCQRIGEVIQRRPEVVNGIADDERDPRRNSMTHLGVDDLLGVITIALSDQIIRFGVDPLTEYSIQFFQVGHCSTKLLDVPHCHSEMGIL